MKHLQKYFKKKNLLFIIFMIISILMGSLLSLWPIRLIERIVDLAQTGGQESIQYILILGGWYLFAQFMGALFNSLSRYLSAYLQNKIGVQIQNELYQKLLRVSIVNLQSKNSLEITNTLVEDSEFISNNLVNPISRLFTAIVSFIIGLAFMLAIDYRLTLIILPCGLISMISARAIKNKSEKNIRERREKSSYLWKIFAEGIKGIMPIRLYRFDGQYREDVQKASSEMEKTTLAQHKLENSNIFLVSVLFMWTIGIILITSSIFVVNGIISIGSLTAVLMYNGMLVDPLIEILNIQQNLIKLKVSLKRINQIFEMPDDENTIKDNVKIDKIILEDLNYNYDNEVILNGINLAINSPANICIMGESGSGKTTLANIVAGLYSPSQGKLNYYFQEEKANGALKISYLIQDGYLFDKSILDNIKIANPCINETDFNKLIEICCLENVYLTHGNKPIGEGGSNLSGGEKKRVRIAQMLANQNADIYIFDELTSALDEMTARKILQNIFDLNLNKICLFIEHDSSVAQLMDEVYVVEGGYLIKIS